MSDYKVIKITPKLKGKLKASGRRKSFSVIDDHDRKYMCFNYLLYDLIKEGKEVEVRIAEDKRAVIVSVVGHVFENTHKRIKPPKNKAEAGLFNLMSSAGWEVTKRGWPDFACFKDGKFVCIEVKPKRSHSLKMYQHKVMFALMQAGVKCYRWSPNDGFEPILDSVKFPINLP